MSVYSPVTLDYTFIFCTFVTCVYMQANDYKLHVQNNNFYTTYTFDFSDLSLMSWPVDLFF